MYQETWWSIVDKLIDFRVCLDMVSKSDLHVYNIASSASGSSPHLDPTIYTDQSFQSQNMLFLHLLQKVDHTEIESFPAFVLFVELACHLETKPGGSNPYGCCFGRRWVIWKEHRHFALESAEDVVLCAQWKTSSRSSTKTEDRRVLLLNRIPSTGICKIGTLRRT